MVKKYILLSNLQRSELCRLVHEEGLTIKEAARMTGIPYPNAKAVNKTYEREQRTLKKHLKFQVTNQDPPAYLKIASLDDRSLCTN